jgi:hypothetical protein
MNGHISYMPYKQSAPLRPKRVEMCPLTTDPSYNSGTETHLCIKSPQDLMKYHAHEVTG